MEKVFINLQENSYYIYIEKNLLNSIGSYIKGADKYFIITDKNVHHLYLNTLINALEEKEIYQYTIEPCESSKSFSTLEDILNTMIEKGLTRKSKIIAFGGGVVGDIAGFCASIYMRGISFIQVPTTLLAQVDSSVGGKTAINMSKGKNMVGSFYQPEAVIIDTYTLNTLPKKEIISGLGEIIKYGIIWDYDFLDFIEKNLTDILNLEEDKMKTIIKKCCNIKSEVVAKDEKELSTRKILNYGHTVAHSIETITEYKRFTHGEAVLIGMYYEAHMANQFGYIDYEYFTKIKRIIRKLKVSLDISGFSINSLVEIMMKDKKNKNGKISFILPKGRGVVEETFLNKEEISW